MSENPTDAVHVLVAQTMSDKSSDKGGENNVLLSEEQWIAIRPIDKSAVEEAGLSGEIDGHVLFSEVHNLTKESAIDLIEMVLSTIKDGYDLTKGEPAEEAE